MKNKLFLLLLLIITFIFISNWVYAENNVLLNENNIVNDELTIENVLNDVNKENNANNENNTKNLNNENINNEFENKKNKSIDSSNIEEGDYIISNLKDDNQVIDISNGSLDSQANVQLWYRNGSRAQIFHITKTDDGYYNIINKNSNLALDIEWGVAEVGKNVWQYYYNNSDAQKWKFVENNDGSYTIVSKLNDLCIDVQDGNVATGSNIQVYYRNGTDAQNFKLNKVNLPEESSANIEEGDYIISNSKDDNQVIDISNGSLDSQANVQLWYRNGSRAQIFHITKTDDGYYNIINKNSNLALDIEWGVAEVGKNVWQYYYNNSDAQKWKFVENNDGSYTIVSKLNDLCIDVQDGNVATGSNIQVYYRNGTDAQNFKLNKVEPMKSIQTIEDGIYTVSLAVNTSKVFDISGGAQENGAKLQIWDDNNVNQQRFKFEFVDGYYKISALHSNKALTVEQLSLKTQTEIIQEDYIGSDSQKWIIAKLTDETYLIISKLSELALDIEWGNISNGTHIWQYDINNSNSQKFKFNKVNIVEGQDNPELNNQNDTFIISPKDNQNMAIDISNNSIENNANVQIWDKNFSTAQRFKLIYDGNGYYNIINRYNGKAIAVEDYGTKYGTNLVQYDYTNEDTQKWAIIKNVDGTYSIISKYNNLYFDVQNGNIATGANMQLYYNNNTSAQKFYINVVNQDISCSKELNDGIYNIVLTGNNGKVLDVTDGSKDSGTKIQIFYRNGTEAQRFKFIYKNGYYKIQNINSGKYLDLETENKQIGNYIIQNDESDSNTQNWILRNVGNGNYNIISAYSELNLDVKNGTYDDGNLIQTFNNNNSVAQQFRIIAGIDIDTNKYPGIQEKVNELSFKHPNWQFEVLYTGIDFYTAVQGEYEYDSRKANLVDTNVYKGDWIAPNPYVSGNWASASYNGIAYFMDTRNFLNDVDAFQFVDLADYYNSGATLDSIQYQVNGTFLNNFAEDVRISCEHQNVNPYYIIARLFQEQGRNGSITIYMDGGDGKQYFNPFNIGAQVGNDFATALAKAKEQGWDSMQKGIEGGITFVKQNYLDAKQNTLYLNKFDVNPNSPGGFYTHQYMQNLSAAYSEARTFRGAYVDTGTLDNTIKFIIPVYENMPETPAARPSGQTGGDTGYPSITDQGPKSVQVYDIQTSLIVRTGPGTQYAEIEGERLQNGTVLLSIERYENGWQRVITPSGTVGYCSGDYLRFINDVTNCNERVAISTTGSVNIRIGPGQSYTSLGTFRDGTTGTRILKDAYFADGYTWDLVILDDGTKGFVASRYLRII